MYWITGKWIKERHNLTETSWPESASELYRLNNHRLSAKLVPTFADRGESRGQRSVFLTAVFSAFYTGILR
jgi:hypothetical protein